ncbi:MAG: hypothetical protein J6J17_00065 [Bacilli bacterium]|nr:hypothetical protein [Bacilli bacterium]
MCLYILFEVIYLLIIFINFFIGTYSEILNIGPVLISIIYTIINKSKEVKGNIYLILSLFFSLLGDIFFLLIDKHAVGISSFIIVQIFYLFFLIGRSNKILLFALLNFIICCIFDQKIIIIQVIIYALLFIINIIFSTIKTKSKKVSALFIVSLICLLICDINVAIISKTDLSQSLKIALSIIEWTSYTLNLILVTLLANGLIMIKME